MKPSNIYDFAGISVMAIIGILGGIVGLTIAIFVVKSIVVVIKTLM